MGDAGEEHADAVDADHALDLAKVYGPRPAARSLLNDYTVADGLDAEDKGENGEGRQEGPEFSTWREVDAQ